MLSKQQITQKVLENLPDSERVSLDEAMMSWWMNFRQGGGMRLTQTGYVALATCDLQTYIFDVHPGLPSRLGQLLILDKKLQCPYFIKLGKNPQLTLFGGEQATMLALYGDLEGFLKYLGRT
jgi:hypothetical protein